MGTKKAVTFEEKINAVMRYYEYVQWYDHAHFLPKFKYLPAGELDTLLSLGSEIEDFARVQATEIAAHFDLVAHPDGDWVAQLEAAIFKRYPFLDAIRVHRLAARSAYYAIA